MGQVFRLRRLCPGSAFPCVPTVAFEKPVLCPHGGGPAREFHPFPYSTGLPLGQPVTSYSFHLRGYHISRAFAMGNSAFFARLCVRYRSI